jgi:hypothetical protein
MKMAGVSQSTRENTFGRHGGREDVSAFPAATSAERIVI